MGSSSSCTCNARVCNYHKKGGYGIKTGEEVIDTETQVKGLKDTLEAFMDYIYSPVKYLKTGVQSSTFGVTESQAALNKLRNTIASVTPIKGLTMSPFCVGVDDSYKVASAATTPTKPSSAEPFVLEGYTSIKPKSTCSAIICIIAAIVVFTFIGYLIYRYINCPCRKRHEKELREAEALEYAT